ncbi:lipid A deacylase LpxR family protein [Halopseudomonas pelagia]|uniref:Lipid A deacylase LpxR family protein n=1 Tax=Halopseudomonas pelagia TaxID=553151 RepID=A0AA91U3V1_9GAMM|nr:lipid A deacylase LpxR family protein [Halopseudomonas pelagia]PCC99461.1 hypothetical protein CO192_10395 [Halopseudomonas pelagia]QFY56463.1 lipid A deacylase LpxR family protein [Halopseudomonas pelagia]
MIRYCCWLLLAFVATSTSADGLLSLKVENDAFSAGGDRHYTNGIEGVWAFEPPEEHWTRSLAERLPGWSGSSLVGVTYRFGQQMYTPSDIEAEALIKDDRPYAGLVYGGVSLLNNIQHDDWRLAESLHLDVGIVGPASGAEALQKGAHRWIGSDEPRGWDNQLNNELVVNLAYQRAWVFQQELGGLDVEYGPSSGFALGNLYTYASSGLGLRWGEGLDHSFGIPAVAPGYGGRSSFKRDQGFGWYVFTAVEGRYMARNLLLDGNTFEDSHSVERRDWVGDALVGAALTWDRWQLTYTYLWRTDEFEEQDGFDQFGSITLSTWF